MKTSELIELLEKVEFGASGRARTISFVVGGKFIAEPDVKFYSSGDGCAGAELTLEITSKDKKCLMCDENRKKKTLWQKIIKWYRR